MARGAGAGVTISGLLFVSGVGSRFIAPFGYGPEMLIDRFAEAGPFAPRCTTRNGVPRSF